MANANLERYNDGLVLLPFEASIKDVLYAIGNREITFINDSDGYYMLEGAIKENEANDYVRVYMTPENKVFAITVLYIPINSLMILRTIY